MIFRTEEISHLDSCFLAGERSLLWGCVYVHCKHNSLQKEEFPTNSIDTFRCQTSNLGCSVWISSSIIFTFHPSQSFTFHLLEAPRGAGDKRPMSSQMGHLKLAERHHSAAPRNDLHAIRADNTYVFVLKIVFPAANQ